MLIEPTAGLMDQVTPWLLFGAFVTVAWNCWVCAESSDTVAGLTATETGTRLIEKDAHWFPNVEHACPVTVVAAVNEDGAVYVHVDGSMVPIAGVIEQVNVCGTLQLRPLIVLHARLPVNRCVCVINTVEVTGITDGVKTSPWIRMGCVPGEVGGGNDEVMVIVVVSPAIGIGGTLIVPVIVVTPFASGPVVDVGVKEIIESANDSLGAAPNPVPVTVTGMLSPPFTVKKVLVRCTGGAN
jgi:hypothetical protein